MTRSERRLLIDTSMLGVALTFLVTFLDFAGLLSAPERFFYDFRARHCQHYTPRPTTQLVHIDIDDKSLSELGHWPWPRSRLAEIVDEIRIGGAKTMVLDVMLSEPAPFEITTEDVLSAAANMPSTRPTTLSTTRPTTIPTAMPQLTASADDVVIVPVPTVNNDLKLAKALKEFGHAVVPLSLNLNAAPNKDPVYLSMVDLLANFPWRPREKLVEDLVNQGYKQKQVEWVVSNKYIYARDEGMFKRIERECNGKMLSREELRARILPKLDKQIAGSVQLRLLYEQYERYARVAALRQFTVKIPDGYPNLIDTREDYATLTELSKAGWATGFFDFVRPTDGTVRFIPLLANHHGYAYPQMGLALACAMLDVQPKDLIVTKESITIPRKGKPIVIPVHAQDTYRGSYDLFIDIPWFGPPVDGGWQRMYDYPDHKLTSQHASIQFIWDACEARHSIIKNNKLADDGLAVCTKAILNDDKLLAKAREVAKLDLSDAESRLPLIREVVKQISEAFPDLHNEKEEGLDMESLVPLRAYKALRLVLDANPGHKKDLEKRRAEIRKMVNGNAVLIGWIAVASIADVVPTSLYSQCPGVVAHGVIFNAIMQEDFWRRPPMYVTPLVTALMGLLVTLIVSRMPPWKALAATFAVAAGYFAFNAYYVFDKHNLIVGIAGPVTAALMVWAGLTLARFMLEANLRAAVTRSFSMRVDPQLVSFVLERDPKVDGQVKELSVVFTDLAGFTTLSEQLKEETVPLLNEYMGLMVPVIRKHKGYLNKFLGDGIMYFFGAPYENPNHAYDAVASVLEMREVMEQFNKSLTERNLPNLGVRAGISSGNMVVGDAGSKDSHDYTVLGDTVNLGARLEPANKVFGTQFLVNARARELIGDRVLFRPIGKIQVAGKTEGVMAYEPLALAAKASNGLHEMADMTTEIVTAFMNAHFEGCIAAIDRMEAAFRVSKLTSLYRRFSEKYIREGTPAGFDGQIVLSEK